MKLNLRDLETIYGLKKISKFDLSVDGEFQHCGGKISAFIPGTCDFKKSEILRSYLELLIKTEISIIRLHRRAIEMELHQFAPNSFVVNFRFR